MAESPTGVVKSVKETTYDYFIDNTQKVSREWKPKEQDVQRFRDSVISAIEEQPWDSGWFHVEQDAEYKFTHALGMYPRRSSCYFSVKQSPEAGVDDIVAVPATVTKWYQNDGASDWPVQSGFWLKLTGINTFAIVTPEQQTGEPGPLIETAYLFMNYYTSGYLRVFLWR